MRTTEYVASSINVERSRQDTKWGGPDHDDERTPDEWQRYIRNELEYVAGLREPTSEDEKGTRQRFVRVAALAIAAIESLDRKTVDAPNG